MRSIVFLLTLLSLPAIQAVDLCVYAFYNCSSFQGSGCCTNLAEGVCCDWSSLPELYGLSIEYLNIPAGYMGWGYRSGFCANPLYGSSSGCLGFTGNPARSGKWVPTNASPKERRDDGVKCQVPDKANFVTADGVQHSIDIPAGEVAEVGRLLKEEDWQGLLKYEVAAT